MPPLRKDGEDLWRRARLSGDANGSGGKGPRDGPRAVAAREEARGLADPRVQGQAAMPEATMDWCGWECELTE